MSANEVSQKLSARRSYAGKKITIHVMGLEESEIVTRISVLLPKLDLLIDEAIKLLSPSKDLYTLPVQLYLVDPLIASTEQRALSETKVTDQLRLVQGIGSHAIVSVALPQDQENQFLVSFTGMLIKRLVKQQAASATFFLNGIASMIVARCAIGPGIVEINAAIRTSLSKGESVSIFASPASDLSSEDFQGIAINNVATSFIAFLIETSGNTALQQFLAEYDAERQDQAALAAYQRPLGQLEEAWLASLRKSATQKNAIITFIRRILPLLKPYRWRNTQVLFYSLLGLAFNAIVPLAIRFLIDTIIPQKNIPLLITFSFMMFGLFLLGALIGAYRAKVIAEVVQYVVLDLQQESFSRLQRLSHHFYAHAKVGDLMSRLSSDLQMVQQAISQVIGNGIFTICNTLVAIVILLSLQPVVGGLMLLIIPLLVLSYRLLSKRLQKASGENQKLIGEVATATQENISAHAVIKAFHLEQNAIGSYRSRLLLQLKAAVHLSVIIALFQNSLLITLSIGQLVSLGVGGYLVIKGNITMGTLLAIWTLVPTLFSPISMFGMILQTIQSAAGAMDRVFELQDEPVSIADKPGAVELPPLAKEICLEHTTFAYEENRAVLDDLNITIPAGTNVAIVGPSGSGKSSIVNLLLRFWDPSAGRILFDNHDLRDITLASLREQIGLVFQDTFIFDTTVRENIAIGRQGATDREIVAAAKGARLDEYIDSLPARYNTMLGERGVRMSGGQRQRLAIARALLRNPRVLILDEATSALDSQTEREILETLEELKRGRTTISITHRLTTASAADHILVLEHGVLVEQGTHKDLLKKGGLYQKLYEGQVGQHTASGQKLRGIDPVRLRAIPLFKEISRELLEKLAQQLVLQRYEMGEYMVHQGEPGDTFYIINYGQVEVLLEEHGTKRRINILDEGDFFGEMSLLVNEPRSASVRATFPTECYTLTKTAFSALLDQEPQIEAAVLRAVNRRRAELAVIQAFLKQADSLVRTSLLASPAAHIPYFSADETAQEYKLAAKR